MDAINSMIYIIKVLGENAFDIHIHFWVSSPNFCPLDSPHLVSGQWSYRGRHIYDAKQRQVSDHSNRRHWKKGPLYWDGTRKWKRSFGKRQTQSDWWLKLMSRNGLIWSVSWSLRSEVRNLEYQTFEESLSKMCSFGQ